MLWQAVSQFELPEGEREVQQMVVCILFGVLTGLFTPAGGVGRQAGEERESGGTGIKRAKWKGGG